MLVNMNDVLYPAKKGKYAVGLFNNLSFAKFHLYRLDEENSIEQYEKRH